MESLVDFIHVLIITIVFIAGGFGVFLYKHNKEHKNDLHNKRLKGQRSHNI